MDNIKLPQEWQQEADKRHGTSTHANAESKVAAIHCKLAFMDGSQTMLTSVQKMLISELPNSEVQEPFIKHLLNKLKTIQP